jgi:hypothetical protein
MNGVVVTDQHELIALHRALFEAQFAIEPHDRDVPGSPLLAIIANRVLDALTQVDPRWAEWREAGKHPDRVAIARKHLLADPRWGSMSPAERKNQVFNQLAPLVPNDDLVSALADAV